MKKKVLKIIALVIAIALIVGIAWVANGLNGNPISKMLAKKAASDYLEEHFPNTDYYIEELGFSFKFTNYYAHIRSESSMDTQFSLDIDMLGNVYFDTYVSLTHSSESSLFLSMLLATRKQSLPYLISVSMMAFSLRSKYSSMICKSSTCSPPPFESKRPFTI